MWGSAKKYLLLLVWSMAFQSCTPAIDQVALNNSEYSSLEKCWSKGSGSPSSEIIAGLVTYGEIVSKSPIKEAFGSLYSVKCMPKYRAESEKMFPSFEVVLVSDEAKTLKSFCPNSGNCKFSRMSYEHEPKFDDAISVYLIEAEVSAINRIEKFHQTLISINQIKRSKKLDINSTKFLELDLSERVRFLKKAAASDY